ncbi:Ornithine decarboxylase [Oleoguttula sp. CCFEE 5521]
MAPSAIHYNNDDAYLSVTKNHVKIDDGFAMPAVVGLNERSVAKGMISAALQKRVHAVDTDICEAGEEDAFFVADMGEVYRQHMRWKKHLGRVTPHYAVKCNPDPVIIKLLAALGSGFDCASKTEIEQVLQAGVEPSRIIYAQPCKTKSYLRYTAQQNVKQMTFDNTDELYKIKAICPQAELYLRILTDDSASLCRLSQKFGASMDSVPELLALARELDLDIAGVAFHVGSGASDPTAFYKAVSDARNVFDQALALGFAPHTLDVGGGFISETFDEMAAALSQALDQHFSHCVRIIAEPGRYYTSAAFTLACNVIARCTVHDPLTGLHSYMLYLNDGVYGNFSSIIFDHQHPVPQVLSCARRVNGLNCPSSLSLADSGYSSSDDEAAVSRSAQRKQIEYSIWGPTCDGIDCIAESWTSPQLVDVGDWLYFEDMGAYTKCSATRFNGFTDKHETLYVCSEAGASASLGF